VHVLVIYHINVILLGLQTNIIKRSISAGEMYSMICRMGRRSFWFD